MILAVLGVILGCFQSFYWLTTPESPPGLIRWFLIFSSPIVYGWGFYQLRRLWANRGRKQRQ